MPKGSNRNPCLSSEPRCQLQPADGRRWNRRSQFPPLTALENCGSRVEGAVIVVELAASMRPPEGVPSGWEDIQRLEQKLKVEREEREAAEILVKERDNALEQNEDMQEELKQLKRKVVEAAEAAAKEAVQKQISNVCLLASRRQTTATKSKLMEQMQEQKRVDAEARAKLAQTEEERDRIRQEFIEQQMQMQNEREQAKKEMDAIDIRLEAAQVMEQKLLESQKQAQAAARGTHWNLRAETRLSIQRAMMSMKPSRAKEIMELREQAMALEKQLSEQSGQLDEMKQKEEDRLKLAKLEKYGRKRSMRAAAIAANTGEKDQAVVAMTEEIRSMAPDGIVEKLVALKDEVVQNEGVAKLAVACFDQIISMASDADGSGKGKCPQIVMKIAQDKETLPAIAQLMEKHAQDPTLQLRGCQMLHWLLLKPGLHQVALSSRCLGAIVRAMSFFTVHGTSVLMAVCDEDANTVEGVANAIRNCCDHTDKDLVARLGLKPRGFLALPELLRDKLQNPDNSGGAQQNCKWDKANSKWAKLKTSLHLWK